MMLLTGFGTKLALANAVKANPIPASRYVIETSMFGPELRPDGTFPVCLDHPKRTKFAQITVRAGYIVGVK